MTDYSDDSRTIRDVLAGDVDAYLDRKKWEAAFEQYDAALAVHPDLGEALYNRGLALHRMSRREAERASWKTYLDRYRGVFGRIAPTCWAGVAWYCLTFKPGGDGLGAGSTAVVDRIGSVITQTQHCAHGDQHQRQAQRGCHPEPIAHFLPPCAS